VISLSSDFLCSGLSFFNIFKWPKAGVVNGFLVNDLGWEKLQKKFSVTKGQIVVKDQI
jgi:hypothetical protein